MQLNTSNRTIFGYMRLLVCTATAVFLLSVVAPRIVAAQGVSTPDRHSSARIDSIARLLAGLPPTSPEHANLAKTDAWKTHSEAIQASWYKVRDGQRVALKAWRDAEIPKGCPVGQTVLYPFSGPDFLNVHWLFPDCANIVMFGLEGIGAVPDIEMMTEKNFTNLLLNVRGFMFNLFVRNYFVTDTMLKNIRKDRLRGIVPVFMVTMALSGVEVLGVTPLDPPVPLIKSPQAASGQADALPKERVRKRKLRGVMIDFRQPGSTQVQHLKYFSLDATDKAMADYPEFLDYLRALAPTTTLIKSASYLLHGNEFSRLRDVILDASVFLVQDDTGLPYGRLRKRGWEIAVYGTYQVPIPPFQGAYQKSLAAAYEKQKPRPLPFRFGYQLISKQENRSNLMIARLSSPQGGSNPGTAR